MEQGDEEENELLCVEEVTKCEEKKPSIWMKGWKELNYWKKRKRSYPHR